ncbi:MAG: prepilin-type N-terminal cleavage/methylation domain-containing protein [Candidatus Sumerlaeaceae bacterium]|nr:prepilin-type N-terminal cleavage/methylation domain-containing protein [Candidatus Sumerlaeaceae bacterium]
MKRAFTLIELLVVVAIIAILAALAVVNYQQAQVRAKVAVVRSDFRTMAASLEAYATDFNGYPPAKGFGIVPNSPFLTPVSLRLMPLTSPIAYQSSFPRDPFLAREGWAVYDQKPFDTYDYVDADDIPTRGSGLTSGGAWRINSGGPDLYQAYGGRPVENPDCNEKGVDYDPTNGVTSQGDIVRVGPLHTKYGDPHDLTNPNRPGIVRVPQYVEQWQ